MQVPESVLLQLLEIIYDAATNTALLPEFLEGFAEAIGGTVTCISEHSPDRPELSAVAAAVLLSEFHTGGSHNREDLGESEQQLLMLLMPHLQRALHLRGVFGALSATIDNYKDVLEKVSDAVILLDEHNTILFANTAAENALNAGSILSVRNGKLAARKACDELVLIHLVNAARLPKNAARTLGPDAVRESVKLTSESGALSLSAVSVPSDRIGTDIRHNGNHVVALFARDLSAGGPSSKSFSKFGLTSAESKVAESLVKGASVADIATKNGTSVSTVRSQLRSIFGKTGTSRQAELICKLLLLGR
jgi:DNA-binding CsgD family transcriptional regulator